MSRARSRLFILIGPSGVGKTTLVQEVQKAGLLCSLLVTCTTRKMRAAEQHSKDYFFLSHDEYAFRRQAGEFLTSHEFCGNHYGISEKYLNASMAQGLPVVSCLTADAAVILKRTFAGRVTTIFITPPSLEELSRRLEQRNSENADSIARRLKQASIELLAQHDFDHLVVNDDLEVATQQLHTIFKKESGGK